MKMKVFFKMFCAFFIMVTISFVASAQVTEVPEETQTIWQTISQIVSWLLAIGALGLLYSKFPQFKSIIDKILGQAVSSSVDLNNVAVQATEATNALVDYVTYVNNAHKDAVVSKEEQETINKLGTNLIKEFKDVPASIKELVEKLKNLGK